jgi:hypothetical protein
MVSSIRPLGLHLLSWSYFMRHTATLALLALPLALGACSAKVTVTPLDNGADAGTPVTPVTPTNTGDDGGTESGAKPVHAEITKVDLLFMIDNSASMGDKQALLAKAVPDLLDRIVNPRCLDASGAVVGKSTNGVCASGQPEAPAIHDIHVGIVDSSLGGMGSDQCKPTTPNPTNTALNGHNDDQGHLITRGGDDEHAVADAAKGFLAFAPGGDAVKLVTDFQEEVGGVHQYGCGFEAQLEAWYRFLVQPDPYASIEPDQTGFAHLKGIDATILQQRHDFLRPDSLLNVIVLTDENDSVVDPMALGGQGWAYENLAFPGSSTSGAPKGTSACAADPTNDACSSCGFCHTGSERECADPVCAAADKGYYGPVDDSLNERMFHMKQRFGVDPQFPIDRYVRGLSQATVPDRTSEHPVDSAGRAANYVGTPNCTNPLFAASLPTDPTADLCHLPPGGRTPDMIQFSIVGGVPADLLHYDPTQTFGAKLQPADWSRILGSDPLAYKFDGADPRMLESMTKRTGVADDYTTNNSDLEYACTFDLPAPRDCTTNANKFACDCDGTKDSPLCDPTTKTTQVKGKAYPAIRELAVARALGDQAVVGSICVLHATEQTPGDPLFGYRPAVKLIGDRLAQRIAN